MIVRLIIFTGLLIVGIVFGLCLKSQEGLIILAYHGKSYEVALWFGVLLNTLSFVALYYLIQLLQGVFQLRHWLQAGLNTRRAKKSVNLSTLGLIDLLNGEWASAEKKWLKAIDHTTVPLAIYYFLAQAAHGQAAPDRVEQYLARAAALDSDNKELLVGIALIRAEFALDPDNQSMMYEPVLSQIKILQIQNPSHLLLLKTLKKMYWELKDWHSVVALLPQLKKKQLITETEEKLLMNYSADEEYSS